jgi:hypothetical protein
MLAGFIQLSLKLRVMLPERAQEGPAFLAVQYPAATESDCAAGAAIVSFKRRD